MFVVECMIDVIVIKFGCDFLEICKLNFYDGECNMMLYGMLVEEVEVMYDFILKIE